MLLNGVVFAHYEIGVFGPIPYSHRVIRIISRTEVLGLTSQTCASWLRTSRAMAQSDRHFAWLGAAHLAGAQTATGPLAHLQALARPQLVAKLTDNVGLGACPRADGWH
jgi:hypothetical protein